MKIDTKQVRDVVIENINMKDSPDFVDAMIVEATYLGRPMTDAELEVLNLNQGFIGECVHKYLY